MSYNWWFVLAGVGAAAAFAASTRLKHVSAHQVPSGQSLRPGALGQFVRATVVHRLWLAGILADCVGLVLQLVALHLGPLTAVQPLLVLALPLALVLRRRGLGRLRSVELGWVGLVVVSLGCFVVLAGTGARPAHAVDRGAAVAAGIVGLLLASGCLALGRHRRGSGLSAALFGVAVGIVYAGTAALLKTITGILARDPISLLLSWQLYTVVALGAAGLMLNQIAFQAGPLTASLPAISTVDPLVSIVVGVWVFDEPIHQGVLPMALLAVSLLVLVIGVVRLARSAADGDGQPTSDSGGQCVVGRDVRGVEDAAVGLPEGLR